MPPDGPVPGSPEDWLAYARRDLAMARAPLPDGAAYENLCFHAQQAAEKAVKAVYRWRASDFRYTLDIDDLLDGLARLGIDIPDEVREAADVTRFAWEARYPGVAEPVTEDEYREAVTHRPPWLSVGPKLSSRPGHADVQARVRPAKATGR